MSTYSHSHDGLERLVSGVHTVSDAFRNGHRNDAPQVFVIVGLVTAAAAALTAWWVAPIEGEIAYQWIGVWTLAVLAILGLIRMAYAVAGGYSQQMHKWVAAYKANRDDQRLYELAKWDHRLADEIRTIRLRDQSDH